jgi:electron transport complex protein RnfG
MAKKESTLLQLILSLTLIAVIAGVALAAVYSITKEPIEKVQAEKKSKAIAQVLPNFSLEQGEIKEISLMPEEGKDPVTLYMAYIDGNLFGAAVETYTDIAFSGRFTIMVGFDVTGNITGTEVLKMNETPGLGDKIDKNKDSKFSPQFVGKNPETFKLKVSKDGGDVDAITAATISSRAFCNAVERAYKTFIKAKEENHE